LRCNVAWRSTLYTYPHQLAERRAGDDDERSCRAVKSIRTADPGPVNYSFTAELKRVSVFSSSSDSKTLMHRVTVGLRRVVIVLLFSGSLGAAP